MRMRPIVNSSAVTAIGYENGVLAVHYKGGDDEHRFNVPPETWAKVEAEIASGGSVGKALHAHVTKAGHKATKHPRPAVI